MIWFIVCGIVGFLVGIFGPEILESLEDIEFGDFGGFDGGY